MSEKIKNFSLIENYDIHFLGRIFAKSFFICFLVWSFLIFQLWWGNHDWGYIRNRLNFNDGFFEARYSQHLFSVILFDGQVLPVFSIASAICFLVGMGVLLAIYMELPERKSIFYIFVLVIGLNPYIFIFFYYLYLALPFMVWPFVGVCGLLVFEYKQNWQCFWFCVLVWFLLLGSYPPNVALILTVFTARRIVCFCFNNEDFGNLTKKYALLCGQFVLAFAGFKLVYLILESCQLINLDMYNIKMRSLGEMVVRFPCELVNSIKQFFDVQTFLGWNYCILMSVPVGFAVFLLLCRCQKNRFILCLLLSGMFLCSRFTFLIAERAEIGFFRMEYFGRLGVVVFALAILGRNRNLCIQNLYLLWGFIALILFVRSDFEIQKLQFLGFEAGRKYQARLVDRIVQHPNFEMKEKYITFVFGYPNFREHFYKDKYQTDEMVGHIMVFYHYIVSGLFWEENINPEVIGTGISGKAILRVDHSKKRRYWLNQDYWRNNPENMNNIRYWFYMNAKQDGVYIDDRYIILVLDMFNFYKNREMVVTKLDE